MEAEQSNSVGNSLNELCPEARKSASSLNLPNRVRAIESSNWTQEEFKLLKTWERDALHKIRIHSICAHRYHRRSKWLRFTTGLISTLAGSGSCISFFIKLSNGEIVWSELIFGLITFLCGLISSTGEAFEWEKEFETHDRSTNDFRKILSDLRTLISSPKLDRKECEFWIHRLAYQITSAEDEAPYLDRKLFEEDAENQEKKRTQTLWLEESSNK